MPDEQGKNTIKELMAAFGTLERPVSVTEYRDFWNSLTDAEKEYYKTAKI
jgi:hypothetical protein